ncbi:MAG TPA: ketopantoate reductase C-terminal domain-containing protein, partial [Anaerolineales bacterium]|nr:ketopantoate reductase C-terminal domain-containing protein [Anaerolineales bacterium]
ADGIDVVLVCVKAYDCKSAADELAAAMAPGVAAVSLLNGIGSEETLAEALGRERVLAASLTTAVQKVEPGVVRVERERGLALAAGHPFSPELRKIFRRAGIETRLYARPEDFKWSKLLTNIVANATSAILGWTAAQVMRHAGTFTLEVEALREAVRVMRKLHRKPVNLPGAPTAILGRGLFLPAGMVRPILARIVGRGRGQKPPSLTLDIGRGRSEIYWLNAAVVEHGQGAGVNTPANQVLTSVFDGLVRGATPPESYRDKPERLLSEAAQAGVPGLERYNRPR